MLLKLCCLLLTLSTFSTSFGQEDSFLQANSEITPLEIGNKVPEEIWQMPFQLVKYKEEPKTIRLEEYRGKTIIIDFWATWCAGCIISMPYMQNLVEAFPSDVVLVNVTNEDAKLISNFLEVTASPQIRQLEDEFSTIVSGQILKDLIPHRSIPYIAVINPEGVLEQTTLPHLLTNEVLGKIVDNEEYYMPKYRNSFDTTILSHTFTDIKQHKPTYYTTLTGTMDGFSALGKTWLDTADKEARGYYINRPILRLFQIALPLKFNIMMPSRRLMVMDDPGKVDFYHERNRNYNDKEFNYSYEYILPSNWNKEQILQRMYDDLSGFTGFHAVIIERDVPCLVIRASKKSPQETKNMGKRPRAVIDGVRQGLAAEYLGLSETGARNYVQATKISSIAWILNNLKEGSVPFVIDETGIEYPIDLDLPDGLTDVNALKTTFARQGLELVPEIRNMEMFVMADRPIDREAWSKAPIELTKFGYVLKEGYSYE